MSILENLFCKKKLQEVSDKALDEELTRRAEVKRRQKHERIYDNVKRCLQYMDNCDALFLTADVCGGGSIVIQYSTRVSWDTIHEILKDGVE